MIFRLPSLALGALCLSSVPYASALSAAEIPSDTPVSKLIASANANLAQGNAQDALTYFDIAIQRDPSNYLTIFKRGATYLSLGRNVQASRDFDQVLTLKPGFEGALTQRAKIKARNADWAGARKDYTAAGKKGDGQELVDLDEAEGGATLSADAEKAGDWEACVTHSGTAILVASTAQELRQRRARCRFEKGELLEGMSDLNHVLQINSALTEPRLQIAAMTFYSLGETDKGITAVAKCLQNDPDNKTCAKLRKSQKSIDRTIKKFNNAFEKRQFATAVKHLIPQGEDVGLLQEVKDDIKAFREAGYIHPKATDGLYGSLVEKTCEAYTEMNSLKKAATYCDEALSYIPNSLPALLSKAQRQLEADEFEPAIGTLNTAKEEHGNSQKIQELLQKAHTLLKRSKTKDYYKVLGVSRDADGREIKRAFRKLTIQWHPDKAAKNGINPEEAQKKMAEINEAYEVLSDDELRARFDRGDDPNDPQAGQQPFQGSPFGFGAGGQPIFFQQRGGGGGNFKFQAGGGGFQFGGGFPGGFPFG